MGSDITERERRVKEMKSIWGMIIGGIRFG